MQGSRIGSDSTAHIESKRFKTTTFADGEIADLPEEIIQDILLRLPVKSLLKSKSVSKSWLSLICSPKFVKIHLKRSAENADFANHKILLTLTNPSFNLKQCSLNSMMHEPRTIALNIDYPDKSPLSALWVVGSCNGIVCIAIDETDVYLWNPATRKSKKLPEPGVDTVIKPGFYYIWGFGYCESEDDYKVVGVFCEYDHGGLQESIVKMYSSRAGSWKRIDDFSYGVPFDDTGKYASGKLHFAASKGKNFESKWSIVSVDLKSEAYGIVEQPDYGQGCSDFCLDLVGDCLSVLCDYQSKRTDVWVLKEESWTRVASIPYLPDPDKCMYSSPLVMMPNGEILLVWQDRCVVYNRKDHSLRWPRICDVRGFMEADIYFETLVTV